MKAYKEYQKMQGLAATRLRLGLSQVSMAIELGISNSLLSQAENGKRSLPTPALAKLAALDIKLAATTSARAANMQPDWSAKERQSIQEKALKKEQQCIDRAAKLQSQLDAMKDRYEKLCGRIHKTTAVLEETVTAQAAETSFTDKHLQLHRDILLNKLSSCGPKPQTELRHKIALLHAEAHLHAMDAHPNPKGL